MTSAIMSSVLTVKEKSYITPHYVRVILEGPEMGIFDKARVGDNNKIVLPVDGKITLPGEPLKGGERSKGLIRTYTLRALDLENNLMTVDFVAHGEEGPASRWAINAAPGSQLGVLMKEKNKTLFNPADWYFLIGDHTALPVISVILESLPVDAKGKAILEVYSEADAMELKKPAGVEINWIFNDEPGENVLLPTEFAKELLPHGSKFVFVAAEYQSVRAIQAELSEHQDLERDQWRAFSYWKYGQEEDASANHRREQSRKS